MTTEKPQILDNIGRNPDGTFAPGHEKVPGSGRPRDTVKQFLAKKLSNMTDEEKEAWLEGISKDLQWQMAEGRPKQDTDIKSDGEKLEGLIIIKDGNGDQTI